MSQKLFIIKYLFLILSLFNLSICQNIITSWHYDKVQMYEMQKIGKFITKQIKEKAATLPKFTEDSIEIENIKLTEVQQSLYDSYLNFNSGLLLLTPNKVSLSFNFSYAGQGNTGSGSFDLKINVFKIRLINNKKDQTQSAQISMFSNENDFTVYEIIDKDFSNKIKTALYKGFEKNKILDDISSKLDLLNYYKDFYKKKKSLNFVTSSFFDSKTITINFDRFIGFCEDINGNAESALCYYSGEIDGEDEKDKTIVPISNNNFVNPNNTFNTFINMDLYNKIIEKVMKEGLSEKIVSKKTLRKASEFDFTVSAIKAYFNGLNSYENNEILEVKIKINELNSKSTKFNMAFNIGSKANAFSLDIKADIPLKLKISKSVRINVCLDNLNNFKIFVKSGNVSIIDESGLKTILSNFVKYLNEEVCLTDNGISLRDYYSIITKAYIQDEGIYLEGKHLYQ